MLPSLSWSLPPFRLDPATGSLWRDAQLVPLPRVHLVRYGGCLAPHSHLRRAIIPTPCQQGVEEQEHRTASPRWSWTRLLKRVFALEMARYPGVSGGRCGSLPPSRTAR
jgi:hypothetical protein